MKYSNEIKYKRTVITKRGQKKRNIYKDKCNLILRLYYLTSFSLMFPIELKIFHRKVITRNSIWNKME